MKGRKSPMVKKVWEMLFTLPSEKEIEIKEVEKSVAQKPVLLTIINIASFYQY